MPMPTFCCSVVYLLVFTLVFPCWIQLQRYLHNYLLLLLLGIVICFLHYRLHLRFQYGMLGIVSITMTTEYRCSYNNVSGSLTFIFASYLSQNGQLIKKKLPILGLTTYFTFHSIKQHFAFHKEEGGQVPTSFLFKSFIKYQGFQEVIGSVLNVPSAVCPPSVNQEVITFRSYPANHPPS